jgi:hypothetical protein
MEGPPPGWPFVVFGRGHDLVGIKLRLLDGTGSAIDDHLQVCALKIVTLHVPIAVECPVNVAIKRACSSGISGGLNGHTKATALAGRRAAAPSAAKRARKRMETSWTYGDGH